jgi:O-antigen/teichoic acid export membrane protein
LLRQLAGGTMNYGLGQSLPMVIGFALIPLYTSILTPADYGIVELAATVSTVLAVLMRFGVPGAVTRFYYQHPEGEALRDYVTSVATFLRYNALAVGTLALMVLYVAGPLLTPGLRFAPHVVLVVATAVLTTNADLQRRLIQVRRQSAYSARLSLASSLTAIALTLAFVTWARLGATGMLLAGTVTAALFLVNARAYLAPDLSGTYRPEIVRASVRYGTGIFISHLLAGLGPYLTRVVLANTVSIASVGLFALANRVASPLTMLSTAFTTAYVPEYFEARKTGDPRKLQALAAAEAAVWSAGALGALAVALFGPALIRVMTPERYHAAAPAVPVLAVGFLGQVLYGLLSPEVFYQQRRWLPSVVWFSNIATTLALTAMWAPAHGGVGVAWATVAGTLVGVGVCGWVTARNVPVPHQWRNMIRATGVAVAAGAIMMGLPPQSPVATIGVGGLLFAAAVAWLGWSGDPALVIARTQVRRRWAALTGRSEGTRVGGEPPEAGE